MGIMFDKKEIEAKQRFTGVVIKSYEADSEYGEQWVMVIYNRDADRFVTDRVRNVSPDSRGYHNSSLAKRFLAWDKLVMKYDRPDDFVGVEATFQIVAESFNGNTYTKPYPIRRGARVTGSELSSLVRRHDEELAEFAAKGTGVRSTIGLTPEQIEKLAEAYIGRTDEQVQVYAAKHLSEDLAQLVYNGKGATALLTSGVLAYDEETGEYVLAV